MLNLPKIKKKIPQTEASKSYLGLLVNDFDISLFLFQKNENSDSVTILFEKTILFDFEITQQSLNANETLKEKLITAVDSMRQLHETNCTDVVVSIGEKFIKSTSATVRLKRKIPTDKISPNELDQVTQKIIAKIKTDFELEDKDNSIELLNYNLTNCKIDGYLTKNLLGLKGTTLDVSLFCSFADLETTKEIMTFVSAVKLNLVTITSHLYTTEKLLKTAEYENYTVAIIKEKTTDIGIVFGGDLSYTMNQSMGYFTFLNFLQQTSKLSFEEIKQFLAKEVINETLSELFEEINSLYIDNLVSTLGKHQKINVYPSTVVLIGNNGNFVDTEMLKEKYQSLKLNNEASITKIEDKILEFVENYKEIKNNYIIEACALAKFCFSI